MKRHTLLDNLARCERELEALKLEQKKSPYKDGFNEFIHRKKKQIEALKQQIGDEHE